MNERYYNTPIFKDDEPEPDIYRCGWCLEDFRDNIYFDHTINGNVCECCLEDEDHQSMLGMTNNQYYNYKNRVLKSEPIKL
jgi:hypothetical protein